MPTEPHARFCGTRTGSALLALLWSGSTLAGDRLTPYLSTQVEYDSNVALLSGREEALASTGDATLDDRVLRYVAGLEARLPLSLQTLRATVEGRRVEYDAFNNLDHDEYLWSGGLDWRLAQVLDGVLEYQQERRMASLADRNTASLSLETERIGKAGLNAAIHPKWRIETGVGARELDSPLPDIPDFALKEKSVNAAVKYLLEATLNAGVFVEYVDGHFEGVPDQGRFHQQTASLTTQYSVSELTRVDAELGYTRREDEGGPGLAQSGVTGSLAYHRVLSGKTSMDLTVFRRVGSYISGASSETQTGGSIALSWEATPKTTVAGSYLRGENRLEDAFQDAPTPDRNDDVQTASLSLTYRMLRWLSLRSYGEYRERDSSIDADSYRSTVAGIDLRARFE